MEEKQLRSMQLFRLMDRMRRAWTVFTPKPEISKSQFGTLLALRHGGKGKTDTGEPPCRKIHFLRLFCIVSFQFIP